MISMEALDLKTYSTYLAGEVNNELRRLQVLNMLPRQPVICYIVNLTTPNNKSTALP